MFFNFRQNNSGGFWSGPRNVVVRADSPQQANQKALDSGVVYFNGVRDGRDCECCGDRWYAAYNGQGAEQPCLYDVPYNITDLDAGCSGTVEYECLGFTEVVDFVYIP